MVRSHLPILDLAHSILIPRQLDCDEARETIKSKLRHFFESWSRRISDVGNIQQGWAAMALRLVLGDLPLGCNRLRAYDSVGGLPVGTHSCKRHDGEPIKAEMPMEYP
jgi:hypothetical protein